MKTHSVPNPFSAGVKARLRNKMFKEAFEHDSNSCSIGLLIRDTVDAM